jgi:DNA modification methylase
LFCWDKSCGKGPATPFVDAEFAWSSRKNSRNIFRFLWRGAVRQGEYGPSRYKRQHPTEKPPELMIWSMDYARVGSDATVFDPYMGVSPVGVACIKTGRRYIGIEIERRYFDIACKRLENEYAKQAA